MSTRFRVLRPVCAGCGMCAYAAKGIFYLTGGKSCVIKQPTGRDKLRALDAMNGCPVNAILKTPAAPGKVKPEDLRLYAVTDRFHGEDDDQLLQNVASAIEGGATMVQLREKHLSDDALLALAKRFVALCREKGAISIINDRPDIAAASGADGAHVGQSDEDVAAARAVLGPDRIIGVSAHNIEEALAAEVAGADYLGSGAAFVSDTKSDAKPIARETLQAVASCVQIPVCAIGGITHENISELSGLGLSGAAVVSALFAKDDVKKAAEELLPLCEALAR